MATAKLFGQMLIKALNKEVQCAHNGTNLKLMLTTNTVTPDQDNWVYKSSVTNEVTGTGYTAGGAAISPASVTYTAGTNLITIDGPDITWSNSTITARWGIVYDSTSTNFPLIAYIDFGGDITSTNGNFTVQFDANGIATVTVS